MKTAKAALFALTAASISASAFAAVDAPRGSKDLLNIPTQIFVEVNQCENGKAKSLDARFYSPEEMEKYGLVVMDKIKDAQGNAVQVEITQVPQKNPAFIDGKVYVLVRGNPMATVAPVAEMVLSTTVKDDLSENQLGANNGANRVCRNPLNEGRYLIDIFKGHIE